MKKYILSTHERKPLSKVSIDSLQKKGIQVIFVHSWPDIVSTCEYIDFDLILGYCNYNRIKTCRILEFINDYYLQTNRRPAHIVLHEHAYSLRPEQFKSLGPFLRHIFPKDAMESDVLDTIIRLLRTKEKISTARVHSWWNPHFPKEKDMTDIAL
ncbi:hypothetical protein DesfrDRAFT_2489 [Solidesulfovibrio fructosivorans JJ]]|uniref:Uncharacterized protein n=1 Tax=Solidesulfovibrio fructosivorans JJ] TaxID=596151 RepID=E1JXZ0_SOLFR|nr:hypothetical protein [Solidesulfovibrio fructosivorans]EFL50728.1 hypothetical protein DesfrDRAFT_2489 [Solidesulfovibrio fructosivorans JJ]]